MAYLADPGPETALGPLQQAACTYRIALGPRAGQKVLSLQTVPTREPPPTPVRGVDEQGFSLHAEVCCASTSTFTFPSNKQFLDGGYVIEAGRLRFRRATPPTRAVLEALV
jgi:hypothetical protein